MNELCGTAAVNTVFSTGGSFDNNVVPITTTDNCTGVPIWSDTVGWYQWYPYSYPTPIHNYWHAENSKEAKFCQWLEGYMDAKDGKLTQADCKKIREKLAEVT